MYLLTLTFGVCLFYTFSSLDGQGAMIYLTQSQNPMAQVIQSCIDVFSVFVAVVLACLILYADRFLMRRRKRELGTYLLLGLSQGQVSLLLVLETGLIGAACVSVVLEVLTNIVVASPETGLFNQFQLGDGGLAGLISWPGLILAAVLLASLAAPAALAAEGGDTVFVRTAEDLVQLAENCTLDSWSQGRIVRLEADIDLSGTEEEAYGRIVGGLDDYAVPLMDMFFFAYDKAEEGYVDLDEEQQADLDDLYEQLDNARVQMLGENYTRMLINLNLPEEGAETFAFLQTIHREAERYYDCLLYTSPSPRD